MSLVEVPVDERGAPLAAVFLDSLVTRLAAEFGVDVQEVRDRAQAALATFATAPVRTFVPILVEKRLRASYRGRPAVS
jgi:hypothetical protein